MDRVDMALLRGICQMPAYAALERGFFAHHDLDVRVHIASTAWLVPEQMARGQIQFAVIPWTRVAAADSRDEDLVAICGSGCEEAALVLRAGVSPDDVQAVGVPQEGGMKDLTAAALMRSFGWERRRIVRMPSGDGAILALVGCAADAASMVEPYATMLAQQGLGTVVKRTGDVWPGAPGCSLTTTHAMLDEHRDLAARVVAAFLDGARFVEERPDEAAALAEPYIGIGARFIRKALEHNHPNVDALSNSEAIDDVLSLMLELGYIERRPSEYLDISMLRELSAGHP
jgi:ABC-type nitrate/sulfonate/bicarbonate transport system substrate-binding protein